MSEYVVLVNEQDEPIGRAEKFVVHSAQTPLHRGFSLFLFNKKKELLLQQRSLKKKAWPGVWSNSVCGHPRLNESPIDAAKRRLAFELGIYKAAIFMTIPTYRYQCEKDGISENEICPVLIGFSDEAPKMNPDEARALRWISWDHWVNEVIEHPAFYSPWCVEETVLLRERKVV
jgi:isopentenyl-diphosphate Delta-isomerase